MFVSASDGGRAELHLFDYAQGSAHNHVILDFSRWGKPTDNVFLAVIAIDVTTDSLLENVKAV